MNCENCGSKNTKVTHTFVVEGASARTQRMYCHNCGVDYAVVCFVVAKEPQHGEGAAALARKLRGKKPRLEF